MRHHLQSADEGPAVHPAVIPDHGQLARENERLSRELFRHRAYIEKEISLLRHWADSIRHIRSGQSVTMLQRMDELRKLINPAAAPTPGVPAPMRAAESQKV